MGDYALTVCPICHMDVENCVCSSAIKQEPMPKKGDAIIIQDEVIKDIEARKNFGYSKYGTYLQPNNGRNSLLDAYQEALDLVIYLKQKLIEEANET